MTDTHRTVEVLKVDAVGRVCTPREKREEIVAAYRKSGMTGRQFAQYIGVKYPTLMSWIGKANREGSGGKPTSGEGFQWVEAHIESGAEALVVEIGGMAKMEVSNSKQAGLAAQILSALAASGKPC
jgi:transposase-like protein